MLLVLADDADARAAAYAFQEAERRGVGLRVLHCPSHRHITPEPASPAPTGSPGQKRSAREARTEEGAAQRHALTPLQDHHPGVTVDARTVRAAPTDELPAATREAAVVVIGAHRRTSVLGPRPGPVVHTVLHRSHCPVAAVPQG